MVPALILWSHALAALLFGALGLWTLRRAEAGVPRNPLAVALMMTALWALAVAGIGETDLTTRIAESGRNLAWLAFMIALHRRNGSERPPAAIGIVYGVVALVILVALALHVAATAPEAAPEVTQAALLLRMMAAVTALVLVQSLHSAITAPGTAGMRPVVLAIGAIWLVDINVLSVAWLTMGWPHQLVAVRGGAMALITAAIAMGLQRRGEWPMQLSRTVAYQSLSLVAIGLYFALLALATSALAAIGGDNARLLQTAFVFGSTAAILTLVSSPWLRAWIKVKLAKHFFRHRYDYRAEWMRFTETLGEPEGSAPLDERIVKALADLTDSPAGLLLVPQGETLGVGAAWNIDRAVLPAGYGESWHLDRIDPTLVLELDTVEGADSAPPSIRSWDQAWVVGGRPPAGQLSRRGTCNRGTGRSRTVRGIQPPLRLHHARHQESGQPADAGRAQCGAPRRQPRLSCRHGRHPSGFGRAHERHARAPLAASPRAHRCAGRGAACTARPARRQDAARTASGRGIEQRRSARHRRSRDA
ncbi:hypothetical protein [Sphingomonas koreensis]|uniref:hypothetical protein n=1 Tax=Sphingomonas koreensis TaxID=93064 RepID=UPI0030BA15A7